MAKVEYVDLIPAESLLYYKALTAQDRFTFARVAQKITFPSKKRIKGLTQRSLLPQIAEAWNALSEGEKAAWSSAGAESNLNGYRLFVQDKAARIKNELAGNATPSLFHQSWIGALQISDPATELKIIQIHPRFYWVSRKVSGKKGMYEPVQINEDFSLPLVLSINYKGNLTSQGEGSFAKFYAEVWRTYQGVDYQQVVEIPLDFSTDWKNGTATLSSVQGQYIGYSLFIHLYNVRGILYIDNVKATHSGQNWVRDTYCKDIYQGFTRAFYQIPKHWAAIILPDGSEFGSIYADV